MEQLDYNLLFRWFVGLGMDAEVWDATVFSKNRERLIAGEVAQKFFAAVREQAERAGLLSDEHFTVDGTLIEAWASRRSYEPNGSAAARHGSARTQAAARHACVEDGSGGAVVQAQRRGRGQAQLSGTCDDGKPPWLGGGSMVTESGQRAEREAALAMLRKLRGADRPRWGPTRLIRKSDLSRPCGSRHHAARGRVCAFEELAELVDGRRTRACGFRAQSAETQTGGTGVWLDQSDRRAETNQATRQAPGGLDVPYRRHRLQPGSHAKVAGDSSVNRRKRPCSGNKVPSQGRTIGHGRSLKISQRSRMTKFDRFSAACSAVPHSSL